MRPGSTRAMNSPLTFAKISTGKPYSNVLVSVPGTQEASDAVLLAQVPTTAVVNRAAAEASVKVIYAGEPQFVVIEGTTMYYAVNTQNRVIRVGSAYYLCYQGIWFISVNASGPWKTADTVPAVIYTIPPSSPVYNVTYVVVSNPTAHHSADELHQRLPRRFRARHGGRRLRRLRHRLLLSALHLLRPALSDLLSISIHVRRRELLQSLHRTLRRRLDAVYGPYASRAGCWYNPTTGTYGRAVTYQNAYGGHTYAQAYNPWTGTTPPRRKVTISMRSGAAAL